MPAASLILAGAAMLAAAAPASDREADVGRAIFELCPKVLDGTLLLDDEASLAAIGYRSTPPRQTPSGAIPRATHGAGPAMIVMSGRKDADGGTCGVWFGGPDNKPLFKAIRKKARQSGFQGGDRPAKLGDGTDIYGLRAIGSPRRTLVFIAGAAGDGIGSEPTTTAMLMDSKGE